MAYQSGTTTLVTGTETTLGNVNSVGEFLLVVDLVNMAAADVTEIRSYQTVLSSGTSRVADYVMYAGAQPTDAMLYISNRYVNDLIEKDSIRFTMKQTFGTGRAYAWKIVQVGPPNFHLLSVSATGAVTVGVNNDKTGYSLSSPQSFNLIGNISGTHVGNLQGTVNAVQGGFVSVTGTVVSSVVQGGTVTVSGTVTATVASVPIVGMVTGSVGSVVGLTPSLLDVAVSSRMASGTVVVGTNNDKTGYSLTNNQVVNFSGTITNVYNVLNPVTAIQITGSVNVIGLNPALLDVAVSSRMASGTVTVGTNNDKTGYGLNTGTLIQAIVNQVWDEQNGLHLITGSTGKSLSSASSAGDPWSTNIPGAYIAGQAGFIVGGNLDARVSSRMISGSVTVGINNDKTGYLLSGTSTDPWLAALPGAYGAGTAGSILGNNLDVKSSSRMASGTVVVGTNNDKTNYSLANNQVVNFSGTITNVYNVLNPVTAVQITGSVNVIGLNPALLDVAVSSRMASGTVVVTGLNTALLDVAVSSRMASGTVTVGTNNDKTGYGLSTGTLLSAIADAVWDEQIGGHLVTGSTGKSLSNASSAGDPWTTPIPGAYGAGTAGFIIGTNVDTPISSRLSSGTFAGSYVVPPTAAANATAVLSAATANPIDANVQEVNDVTIIGNGSTTPWGP